MGRMFSSLELINCRVQDLQMLYLQDNSAAHLTVHSGKSLFSPKTSVAIVILFWLKWAGYLAMAGLNLLAQISDRISPYGV